MGTKYVPTGRPPGRPRNDSKPAVERLGIQDVAAMLKQITVDRANRPMDAICPDCFPDGWDGITRQTPNTASTACQHGIWVLRL